MANFQNIENKRVNLFHFHCEKRLCRFHLVYQFFPLSLSSLLLPLFLCRQRKRRSSQNLPPGHTARHSYSSPMLCTPFFSSASPSSLAHTHTPYLCSVWLQLKRFVFAVLWNFIYLNIVIWERNIALQETIWYFECVYVCWGWFCIRSLLSTFFFVLTHTCCSFPLLHNAFVKFKHTNLTGNALSFAFTTFWFAYFATL